MGLLSPDLFKQIDLNNVKILQRIGKGTFGEGFFFLFKWLIFYDLLFELKNSSI